MVKITCQTPADNPAIEDLLERAFGCARLARPSYRLRDGVDPLAEHGFVARDGDRLIGTVRFWPITVGGANPALLLGPLAVDADYRNRQAVASSLIKRGLGGTGTDTVIAVGDPAFFGRFGFTPATPLGLTMPGLADTDRLLVRGALEGVAGSLRLILRS